jgi:hypothetical protein
MNDIEKLDNVTWYGHCVIHVMAAISDLPDEAKLVFCQDLEKFIRRQERVLSKAKALRLPLARCLPTYHKRDPAFAHKHPPAAPIPMGCVPTH